jgi:PiT family inorganic phosphate transporter
VSAELVMLVLVVVTALAFDFTNGFHDTGNAMAASIATGALRPKPAVALSAILNLVGAFLSVQVALTVTNAVVNIQDKAGNPRPELVADGGQALLLIILAGLVGGIAWNLFTWLLGLPSSSSHALLGGLVGAALAGLGLSGVKWVGDGSKLDGVVGKVLLPSLLSPVIALTVASVGSWVVFRLVRGVSEAFRDRGFRWGQVGSASLVSLAHGTNDAQKTMGVITLALVAAGDWDTANGVPFWVKLSCAVAIALGTYLGGWRIIRTLGKGLVDIIPPQGMAGDASTASVILASSHLGFALSTTHVATGSILGAGVGRGTHIRWRIAGRMALAWATTFPSAALVGAAVWVLANAIGGAAGAVVIVLLLAAAAAYMYHRSRKAHVGAHNVTADWDEPSDVLDPVEPTVPASSPQP